MQTSQTVHIAVLLHEVVEGLRSGVVSDMSLRKNRNASGNLLRDMSDTTPPLTSREINSVERRTDDSRSGLPEGLQLPRRESSVQNSTVTYLDGTLGGAGHALAIAKVLDGKVTIVGLDRDMQAIERAEVTLKGKATKIILANEDYRNLDKVLDANKITAVDMILLDLGLSSDELENSGKGFTFQKDEPLLMTMGDPTKYPFTAKDIVNNWSEEVIADVIFGYGEERYARRIAKALVSYRDKTKIESSAELAEVIKSSVPSFYRRGKIHPATKTFQALRIAVNDELNALKQGLNKGYERLSPGGRMAVISFHSLEDRIVKNFYKEKSNIGADIITKKPITASEQEKAENPRSRSAKLRIIQKHLQNKII